MSHTPEDAARRRQSRVLVLACLLAALLGCLATALSEGSAPAGSAAPRDHLSGASGAAVERPIATTATPVRQQPETSRARRDVAQQLITVTASSTRTTRAAVQRWTLQQGRWIPVSRPVAAEIGAAGLTDRPVEGRSATPLGVFTLTDAFGAGSNAGHVLTRMDYRQVRYGDSWGSDPGKPTYNRLWNCRCDAGELYRLRETYFRYGLVIDYNRDPVVRGAGSGFFVHVTDGYPTGGCVGMPAAALAATLRWLDPAASPRILIRVGPASRAPTLAPAG